MTYEQVQARLTAIEEDLANLDTSKAEDFFRAKREYEKAWAEAYIATEGTVDERRNRTILELYDSAVYTDLVVAEAGYEGMRAKSRVLEARASIGQSLLRAMTREAPQSGVQPSWTGRQAA